MSSTAHLPLRALAPAKINLGLLVGPMRPDSRHELVSVMQSISLADELTLERAPAGTDADEIVCPGVPGSEQDNLAGRALAAFRAATGWNPGPLRLTIVKRVPVAGGLGGGSGDAAAALRLAALASGMSDGARLGELARELGADVPAQVTPGRWLARGVGERLTALPAPSEPFGVLVLPVAAGLSTAHVYAEADRLGSPRTQADLDERARRLSEALGGGEQLPPEELLVNDLQRAAISLCPAIDDALARARACGAHTALVSGSGPTVLGLFAGLDGPAKARRAAEELAGRDPAPLAAVPVDAHFARVRNNASS